MNWSWSRFLLTLVVGLVLLALYHFFFRNKGKKHEEVYDRVVEESTDESTKLKTLTDQHAAVLKERDTTIGRLQTEHGAAIAALKTDQVTALGGKETSAVQGLVGATGSEGRVTELESELALVKGKLADSEKARTDVAASATAAADANAKRVDELAKKAAADAEASAKRITELESEHASLNTRFVALQGDHDTARSSHASLNTRFLALQGEHDTTTSAHAACASEIAGLKAQLADATAGPDDLTLIEGIGPKMDQALRAAGITRWVQVRDADEARLHDAVSKAGMTLAPSIPTWSKQAAFLVSGDQVGFKKYTDYLVAGVDPAMMKGARELTGADAAAFVETAATAGNTELKNADGTDNLQIIEGIGPGFNAALGAAGITTFRQLADASGDTLKSALTDGGLSFAPSLTTWAKQAGYLATGNRAGFDEYINFLVAGRDPSA
jgi:predicted flap endonuclease-1-like 5' DNA nuclease